VANLGSYIRSAARATFSAYKSAPIRWRLAGGSAALTLVILCGFAVIVGVLTTRRIHSDFNQTVSQAADDLSRRITIQFGQDAQGNLVARCYKCPDLTDYAASQNAAIRVVYRGGELVGDLRSGRAPFLAPPRAETQVIRGWRIETRPVPVNLGGGGGNVFVQYARRVSEVQATAQRVKLFLALGVLGGTALALLAGLSTARRAMEPITELTATARAIGRTRDPSLKIPHPKANDEIAELARTLESMLLALNEARGETEGALRRQREFVADASHELRTPLTSVLANLELLEEELQGEQKEAAASALRSSRRMRRLVSDLLLLARADAGRIARHEALDLSDVVTEAAGELLPVAGRHAVTVSAPPGATISGARDELHRLALNLLENALRHTDPGTAVQATVERANGEVVFSVEDDGPGIPPDLRERVFERFYRGSSDRGGSSGLGLSIVRAVAESHEGSVVLEEPLDGRGARFVVRIPAAR
jgi:two-component system OmpR family sensor kinase